MTNSVAKIFVVLFCGGRGSATIIQELLRRQNIQLTLIVNAYDDGLSTGELRHFINEMLGPSDFRKNLSYLLDLHSEEQYALKHLLEFRFPTSITNEDITRFINFIKTGEYHLLIEPLHLIFYQLENNLLEKIRSYLHTFFNYASSHNETFNYCDCSMGNLIFAGIYLNQNKNFNAALKTMSELVSSRGLLVNVSQGENKVLIALKENGEILINEATVVGLQSPVSIRSIFLLDQALSNSDLFLLNSKTMDEKIKWLKDQETLPSLSSEAMSALKKADIILYGPGTQHSSLFPSYRIAEKGIKASSALIKAFIMNLEPDHDIQTLTASEIIDHALYYLNDFNNHSKLITHILLNRSTLDHSLPTGLLKGDDYKNALIIKHEFANDYNKKVHNGRAVMDFVLKLWEEKITSEYNHSALNIFIDIYKRSLATDSLAEEFLEMNWDRYFSTVYLTINKKQITEEQFLKSIIIKKSNYPGIFPEMDYFYHWLNNEKTEYLVLLTGDGEYRFRDVLLSIKLLENSHFGAVFGSRTQSRLQYKTAIKAAYGENKLLRLLSTFGAFILSAIYTLRYGVIFSDPLTGFRIFRRSKILHLSKKMNVKKAKTPIAIAKHLIYNNVEIAELPVNYRTFVGFTDPYWRIRRGVINLLSMFSV